MSMQLQSNDDQGSAKLRRRMAELLEVGLTPQRVSVETGVQRQDLLSWVDGKTKQEKVESAIALWFEQSDAESQKQIEPEWVETPSSMDIHDALSYAQITPTISLVYGGAGVSKTTTAKRFCSQSSERNEMASSYIRSPKVYYVSAAKYIATPAAILEAIAEIISPYGVQAYRKDQLAKSILRVLHPGDLLIVDEAQHLEPAALDGIRYFHDEAQIGIAYLGNEEVYTRINGKARKATFAQLSSRVGMRLHIELPTIDDVDAILEAWAIYGKQTRELAHQIAHRPGGLRGLTQVLRQARVLATGIKTNVDAGILKAAASRLDPHFKG